MSAYLTCPECGCLSAKWQPQPSHRKGCGHIHTHPSTWSKDLDERMSGQIPVSYGLEKLTNTHSTNLTEKERSSAHALITCGAGLFIMWVAVCWLVIWS
jgi:hypothetical protein